MPKIQADTVFEHRENQRARLLKIAKHLLVTDGPKAVTPGSIAKLAGISRPAVYQYFENGNALMEQVVLDDFQESMTEIASALAQSATAREKVTAYLTNVINQAASGMHLTATALTGWPMPVAFKTQIESLHRKQIEPFIDAMRELGVVDHIELALIGGLVETAVRLAESGMAAQPVIETLCMQVDAILACDRSADHHH
ncbi:MAG: hypothetical protein RJA35_698 [Actinomycetota bacterium]|jgi:AcrR family transcriptional regulator